ALRDAVNGQERVISIDVDQPGAGCSRALGASPRRGEVNRIRRRTDSTKCHYAPVLLRHKPLMVRSAKRVSNHEARLWPTSLETPALRAPQDEGLGRLCAVRLGAAEAQS